MNRQTLSWAELPNSTCHKYVYCGTRTVFW